MWDTSRETARDAAQTEAERDDLALIAVQRRLLPEVRNLFPSAVPVDSLSTHALATIVAECRSGTIARHVMDAFAEAGVDVSSLPVSLREVVEAMWLRECTPDVRDVVPAGMSERTFRRLWARYIGLPPGQVLTSIRLRHACWLVHCGGMTRSAAALAAGFNCARQLRRALRRFSETECRRGVNE